MTGAGAPRSPRPRGDPLDDHGDLGELMGRIARSLQSEHGDVEDTLQAITAAAVSAIPGATQGTVSYVAGRRRVESRAATGPTPRRLDEVQQETGQGPCLDSMWEHRTVRIDDMRTERRWPRFTAAAVDLGVLSSLSFQLFVEGDDMGALNLYAPGPAAFDQESEEVGAVFASHAAIALTGARHEADLRSAIGSRDLIGQAKGILMERHRLTADQAFAVLARASQHSNRKVTDIAGELAETGALPAE